MVMAPGSAGQYAYAPDNKRVWKKWNSGGALGMLEELAFWSVTGQRVAMYNLTVYSNALTPVQTGCEYYFGGKLVKNAGGYVHTDRLGSVGKYYPYGQERPSATTNNTEKFATYFRDGETGLDYADQRYHAPGSGRFLSPDPYMASGGPSDPGSWNRYAYVEGDPINFTDRSGQMMALVCGSFTEGSGGMGDCVGGDFGLYTDILLRLETIYNRNNSTGSGCDAYGNAFAPGSGSAACGTQASNVAYAPPKIFVLATSDCYKVVVGALLRGRAWKREVTYTAMTLNAQGQLVPYRNAVITEHLSYISGPHPTPSSSKPGEPFEDVISVGNFADFTLDQTFTVSYQGVSVDAQIISYTGVTSSVNHIEAHRAYVDINRNPNLGSGGSHPPCGN
jgi:RHS repeat-associated protein